MRGSVLDLIPIMIVAVLFVFTIFLSNVVNNGWITEYNRTFNATGTMSSAENTVIAHSQTGQRALLGAIPWIIIGSCLATLVLAYFIPTHPIFLPISFLLLMLCVYTSFSFSNIMWDFINDAQILPVANTQPLIVNIIKFFPLIIAATGFAIQIIQYGRPRGIE